MSTQQTSHTRPNQTDTRRHTSLPLPSDAAAKLYAAFKHRDTRPLHPIMRRTSSHHEHPAPCANPATRYRPGWVQNGKAPQFAQYPSANGELVPRSLPDMEWSAKVALAAHEPAPPVFRFTDLCDMRNALRAWREDEGLDALGYHDEMIQLLRCCAARAPVPLVQAQKRKPKTKGTPGIIRRMFKGDFSWIKLNPWFQASVSTALRTRSTTPTSEISSASSSTESLGFQKTSFMGWSVEAVLALGAERREQDNLLYGPALFGPPRPKPNSKAQVAVAPEILVTPPTPIQSPFGDGAPSLPPATSALRPPPRLTKQRVRVRSSPPVRPSRPSKPSKPDVFLTDSRSSSSTQATGVMRTSAQAEPAAVEKVKAAAVKGQGKPAPVVSISPVVTQAAGTSMCTGAQATTEVPIDAEPRMPPVTRPHFIHAPTFPSPSSAMDSPIRRFDTKGKRRMLADGTEPSVGRKPQSKEQAKALRARQIAALRKCRGIHKAQSEDDELAAIDLCLYVSHGAAGGDDEAEETKARAAFNAAALSASEALIAFENVDLDQQAAIEASFRPMARPLQQASKFPSGSGWGSFHASGSGSSASASGSGVSRSGSSTPISSASDAEEVKPTPDLLPRDPAPDSSKDKPNTEKDDADSKSDEEDDDRPGGAVPAIAVSPSLPLVPAPTVADISAYMKTHGLDIPNLPEPYWNVLFSHYRRVVRVAEAHAVHMWETEGVFLDLTRPREALAHFGLVASGGPYQEWCYPAETCGIKLLADDEPEESQEVEGCKEEETLSAASPSHPPVNRPGSPSPVSRSVRQYTRADAMLADGSRDESGPSTHRGPSTQLQPMAGVRSFSPVTEGGRSMRAYLQGLKAKQEAEARRRDIAPVPAQDPVTLKRRQPIPPPPFSPSEAEIRAATVTAAEIEGRKRQGTAVEQVEGLSKAESSLFEAEVPWAEVAAHVEVAVQAESERNRAPRIALRIAEMRKHHPLKVVSPPTMSTKDQLEESLVPVTETEATNDEESISPEPPVAKEPVIVVTPRRTPSNMTPVKGELTGAVIQVAESAPPPTLSSSSLRRVGSVPGIVATVEVGAETAPPARTPSPSAIAPITMPRSTSPREGWVYKNQFEPIADGRYLLKRVRERSPTPTSSSSRSSPSSDGWDSEELDAEEPVDESDFAPPNLVVVEEEEEAPENDSFEEVPIPTSLASAEPTKDVESAVKFPPAVVGEEEIAPDWSDETIDESVYEAEDAETKAAEDAADEPKSAAELAAQAADTAHDASPAASALENGVALSPLQPAPSPAPSPSNSPSLIAFPEPSQAVILDRAAFPNLAVKKLDASFPSKPLVRSVLGPRQPSMPVSKAGFGWGKPPALNRWSQRKAQTSNGWPHTKAQSASYLASGRMQGGTIGYGTPSRPIAAPAPRAPLKSASAAIDAAMGDEADENSFATDQTMDSADRTVDDIRVLQPASPPKRLHSSPLKRRADTNSPSPSPSLLPSPIPSADTSLSSPSMGWWPSAITPMGFNIRRAGINVRPKRKGHSRTPSSALDVSFSEELAPAIKEACRSPPRQFGSIRGLPVDAEEKGAEEKEKRSEGTELATDALSFVAPVPSSSPVLAEPSTSESTPRPMDIIADSPISSINNIATVKSSTPSPEPQVEQSPPRINDPEVLDCEIEAPPLAQAKPDSAWGSNWGSFDWADDEDEEMEARNAARAEAAERQRSATENKSVDKAAIIARQQVRLAKPQQLEKDMSRRSAPFETTLDSIVGGDSYESSPGSTLSVSSATVRNHPETSVPTSSSVPASNTLSERLLPSDSRMPPRSQSPSHHVVTPPRAIIVPRSTFDSPSHGRQPVTPEPLSARSLSPVTASPHPGALASPLELDHSDMIVNPASRTDRDESFTPLLRAPDSEPNSDSEISTPSPSSLSPSASPRPRSAHRRNVSDFIPRSPLSPNTPTRRSEGDSPFALRLGPGLYATPPSQKMNRSPRWARAKLPESPRRSRMPASLALTPLESDWARAPAAINGPASTEAPSGITPEPASGGTSVAAITIVAAAATEPFTRPWISPNMLSWTERTAKIAAGKLAPKPWIPEELSNLTRLWTADEKKRIDNRRKTWLKRQAMKVKTAPPGSSSGNDAPVLSLEASTRKATLGKTSDSLDQSMAQETALSPSAPSLTGKDSQAAGSMTSDSGGEGSNPHSDSMGVSATEQEVMGKVNIPNAPPLPLPLPLPQQAAQRTPNPLPFALVPSPAAQLLHKPQPQHEHQPQTQTQLRPDTPSLFERMGLPPVGLVNAAASKPMLERLALPPIGVVDTAKPLQGLSRPNTADAAPADIASPLAPLGPKVDPSGSKHMNNVSKMSNFWEDKFKPKPLAGRLTPPLRSLVPAEKAEEAEEAAETQVVPVGPTTPHTEPEALPKPPTPEPLPRPHYRDPTISNLGKDVGPTRRTSLPPFQPQSRLSESRPGSSASRSTRAFVARLSTPPPTSRPKSAADSRPASAARRVSSGSTISVSAHPAKPAGNLRQTETASVTSTLPPRPSSSTLPPRPTSRPSSSSSSASNRAAGNTRQTTAPTAAPAPQGSGARAQAGRGRGRGGSVPGGKRKRYI